MEGGPGEVPLGRGKEAAMMGDVDAAAKSEAGGGPRCRTREADTIGTGVDGRSEGNGGGRSPVVPIAAGS